MELYDNPANLFVAGFLGTANVIEGIVESVDGGVVFHTNNGQDLPLGNAKPGPRHLVFRPQNVAITDGAREQRPGQIELFGSIRHREFLGGIVRYAVDVGGDTVLVDNAHRSGTCEFDTGEEVRLHVSRDQLTLLA